LADPLAGLEAAVAPHYTIERELGRGGMAIVYLARDLRHGRPVAIKVLRPEIASGLARERFLREIQFAASLQHPNILPLYDSGSAEDVVYYVMPFVEGESLRDRLRREPQLTFDDALRITREVADALRYAHSRGIVHRDIKPENILLGGGHALVADFGIARAVTAAADARLTDTGLAVGTPQYMSPEQAGGKDPVDGRTDIYALGCVLYEMLAGEPPFTGRTAQAIIARHLQEPPPSLRVVRPTLPEGVQQAIETALAKVPADRFTTAVQFVEALEGPRQRTHRRLLGRGAMIAGGLAVALGAFWLVAGRGLAGRLGSDANGGVDTSRYVILPFARAAGIAPLNEGELLQDALAHWSGISVVDPFQVKDALARRDGGALSSRDARAVAVDLHAGRYVRGEVLRVGDSIRVYAGLYDAARGGSLLRDGAIKLGPQMAQADSAFAALGDRLLFGSAGTTGALESRAGTASVPARQAYVQAQAAIELWDLAVADSALATATSYDPQYAQAYLWLAQTRAWNAAPPATWQSAAARAAAGRARLSARDQLLSDALVAMSGGDAERACAVWRRLTVLVQYDFAAWYGLGTCLSGDDAVLRDAASPSQWRFRSSYHEATKAYQRAFQLLPSMHSSLRGGSYASVRRLLMTSGSEMRPGRAVAPDTTSFAAYPSWQGDTLAFVPFPVRAILARSWVSSQATAIAVRRQREQFHEIATAWVTAFPRSADAMEAVAISLEMLGDSAALDTLRRARALARTPEEQIRIAAGEVWMRVKFSLPVDLVSLRAARALADSVLRANPLPNAPEPLLLASLAALTGRATQAVAHTRHPAAVAEWKVPPPLAQTALPLLVRSALGGPADSVRALERLVDSAIDNAVPVQVRQLARLQWLARAATLAFPVYPSRLISKLSGRGDYLLDAQAAFLHRDTAAVRQMFVDLEAARRGEPPADVTLDALYPEASLRAALGDDRGAIAWLDPTLAALPATDPETFTDPTRAAALVRAIALRAELAERVGDRAAAARWAHVLIELWSDADPFLQPVVGHMRRLAG
jgi:hypothetical protein